MTWILALIAAAIFVGVFWGYFRLSEHLYRRGRYGTMVLATVALTAAYVLVGYISNHVFG